MLDIKQALKLLSNPEEPTPMSTLLSHASQQNMIQKELTPVLPPSLNSCKISARIQGQELTLSVDNNAQATKLRQLLPSIAQLLKDKNYYFTKIRITNKKTM